jgi:cytoskeletal protein CcmA (bactofilin family)
MFKSKSNSIMAKQSDIGSQHKINIIVDGTRIEGTFSSESNIRIDGSIKGNVDTKGKLVIGPSGMIDGEINCQNAEIEGKIIGKIMVEDLLSLKASARIDGDIYTSKLSIDPGAMFTGSCHMGNKVKQMNHERSEKVEEKSA